jgi:hypothetical protein
MSWSIRNQLVAGAVAVLATLSTPLLTFADELTLNAPAIGVSAQVESIAVSDGKLGTPIGPDNLGALQVPGNLLVVGHRDWDGRRRAFAGLEALQSGDVVELSDGRAYSVQSTSVWAIDGEQDAWNASIAATDGDFLTLISCTGPFSISRHEYLQRVVVRAERIDR